MFSKSISTSILLVIIIVVVVGATFHVAKAAIGNDHRQQQITNEAVANILSYESGGKASFEVPREHYRPITACNVLSVSTTDPFTLRNYGRRINCTLVAVYPGAVRIIALGIGGSSSHGVVHTSETGTLRKCDARSPRDQVQIGGSRGFDTTKLDVIDSICGIDSKPDIKELVAYDITAVRLLSSGYYDNSVTVAISPIVDDSLLDSASGL